MKTRTFFITFLAPAALYLLLAQVALTYWNLFQSHEKNIASLDLSVMLEDSVNSNMLSYLSGQIGILTSNPVKHITAEEEMENFQKRSSVDIMTVLEKNPFGGMLVSAVSADADISVIKTSISVMKGVRAVVYPDTKRKELDVSFEDSRVKCLIIAVILLIALLLNGWLSEHLESAANEPLIHHSKSSRVPYSVIKGAFYGRAFVKGTLIGLFASIVFLLIRSALSMNRQVSIFIDFDKCLLIASVVTLLSIIITFLMQVIAYYYAIKNSR